MKTCCFLIFICLVLLQCGCSSSKKTPVLVNSPDEFDHTSFSETRLDESTGILGIYDLLIDVDTKHAELVEKRHTSIGESYLLSGRSFFSTFPCSDCFTINGLGFTDDNITIDFKIRHPMGPGDPSEEPSGMNRLDLDIFDLVMVVVPMGKTPVEYIQIDQAIYSDVVSEPDAYTTELTNWLSDDTAMPYVLVLDDSDPDPPVGTFNKFPMGAGGIFSTAFVSNPGETLQFELYLTFGYGFSATFENRLNPVYYNPEYNRKAAWKVEVTPPTPWVSLDDITPVFVKVSVYDWQIGANVDTALTNPDDIYADSDVESVSVEIPGMNNTLQSVTGDQCIGKGTPDDPLVYFLPIANENNLPSGNYTGLVKVKDERTPLYPSSGRDFLIHSLDGSNLINLLIPEYATYQTFPVVINDEIVFNPVDRTPEYLCLKAEDIFIYENFAIVAGGVRGVHIFDISDPENIEWLVMVDADSYAQCVYVTDGYIYVGGRGRGLQIIGMRPGNILEIIETVYTYRWCNDIFVSGDYAYLADADDGLTVIYIGVPSAAYLVETVDTDGWASGVHISGDYAYVADREGGLQIIDISVPGSSSIVHNVETPGEALDVTVDWNIAYVADGVDGGLQIVDVSDPETATILKSVALPDANSVMAYGYYAMVTGGETGLHIVHVSPVDSASLKQSIETAGFASAVAASSGYLFVTDTYTGVHSLKVDLPASSYITDTYSAVSYMNGFSIWDENLFIASGLSGMQIVDVSIPEIASIANIVDTQGEARDVSVDTGVACIADDENGFITIDVDPVDSAVILDSHTTGDIMYDVCMNGDYAYALESYQKMHVFSLDPPGSINLETTFEFPAHLYDLFTRDDFAYAVDGYGEFYIVDISTPDTPSIIKTIDGLYPKDSVFAIGDYAYATKGSERLDIISINPPETADVVNSVYTGTFPEDVFVSQGYAYVACTHRGLLIIDIDPYDSAYIVVTHELPRNESTHKVIVSNGFAYIGIGSGGGIRIIDLW